MSKYHFTFWVLEHILLFPAHYCTRCSRYFRYFRSVNSLHIISAYSLYIFPVQEEKTKNLLFLFFSHCSSAAGFLVFVSNVLLSALSKKISEKDLTRRLRGTGMSRNRRGWLAKMKLAPERNAAQHADKSAFGRCTHKHKKEGKERNSRGERHFANIWLACHQTPKRMIAGISSSACTQYVKNKNTHIPQNFPRFFRVSLFLFLALFLQTGSSPTIAHTDALARTTQDQVVFRHRLFETPSQEKPDQFGSPTGPVSLLTPEVMTGEYSYAPRKAGQRTVRLPAGWGIPDLVLVQAGAEADSAQGSSHAHLRTRTMPEGMSGDLWDRQALVPHAITSLGSDSFTVSSRLHQPNVTYNFIAVRTGNTKSFDDYFAYGTYNGKDTAREIWLQGAPPTGGAEGGGKEENPLASWQPDLVVVTGESVAPAVYHTASMGPLTNTSHTFAPVPARTNAITRLVAGGFQVGSDSSVNQADMRYHWFALRSLPGVFTQGHYQGNHRDWSQRPDATHTVQLSGEGFRPEYVWVNRSYGDPGHHRFDRLESYPAHASQNMGNIPEGGFQGGTGLQAGWIRDSTMNGFIVGKNLNTRRSQYHYFALRSTPANSAAIQIATPVNREIIQRSIPRATGKRGKGKANIPVTGRYQGMPAGGTIEARWAGGAWQILDPAPAEGKFKGVLRDQLQGQGRLEVRFAANHAITDSARQVGIGDIFVIAGQSNASGYGASLQQYSPHQGTEASLFGNDNTWKSLADPLDSSVGQIDRISRDTAGGHWALPLATFLLADQQCPVGFVPVAKSATLIRQWAPSNNPQSLYGNMKQRVQTLGHGATKGKIRAVLWWQGEDDALHNTSEADYRSRLQDLATHIQQDFAAPLLVARIGNLPRSMPESIDSIRHAQLHAHNEADNEADNILVGPDHYDISYDNAGGDGLHIGSDTDPDGSADLRLSALRWWAALDGQIYQGGHDGQGPQFASAKMHPANGQVVVSLANDSGALRAGDTLGTAPWNVTVDGVSLALSAVHLTRNNTVILTLAQPLSPENAAEAETRLSFAQGRSGDGTIVPTDSLVINGVSVLLPLQPFLNEKVLVQAPAG